MWKEIRAGYTLIYILASAGAQAYFVYKVHNLSSFTNSRRLQSASGFIRIEAFLQPESYTHIRAYAWQEQAPIDLPCTHNCLSSNRWNRFRSRITTDAIPVSPLSEAIYCHNWYTVCRAKTPPKYTSLQE